MYRLSIVFVFCLQSLFGNGQNKKESFKLDFFTSIPGIIDGCMGAYTYDTAALKSDRYVIITNLQDLAIIKVKGKEISLKRISNVKTGNTYKDVYKGQGYTVILIVRDVKQIGDEGSLETGKLVITYEQSTIEINIRGEAGC
jgi:hypothetical protein